MPIPTAAMTARIRRGPSPEAVRFLVEERDAHGFGTETIGTDAGQAHLLNPQYPAHTLFHGAGRYGLQCLTNLDLLPPTGAVVFAAPLKIRNDRAALCACSPSSMAERSFKAEIEQLRIGAGQEFRGEGILAVTKAPAAIGRRLCRRLSGLADLAPDGRVLGRQRPACRARRAFRAERQRGGGGGDARGVGQLSAARRGGVEVGGRAPMSPPTRSPTSPRAASPAACW